MPQKLVVKPPAVAEIADVDDEAVADSGLGDAKVAEGMNTFLLDLQRERSYVGTSAFLIFALRYRLRVCVCGMTYAMKTCCPYMRHGRAMPFMKELYFKLSLASALMGTWRC